MCIFRNYCGKKNKKKYCATSEKYFFHMMYYPKVYYKHPTVYMTEAETPNTLHFDVKDTKNENSTFEST